MTEDLVAFVQAMDRCWLERRFGDLTGFLADDVVIVAPGGTQRIEGLERAIASYREFMGRCEVERFQAAGHVVTLRGDAAVVEYAWEMDWRGADERQHAAGREILVLARRSGEWRIVWRTQVPAG